MTILMKRHCMQRFHASFFMIHVWCWKTCLKIVNLYIEFLVVIMYLAAILKIIKDLIISEGHGEDNVLRYGIPYYSVNNHVFYVNKCLNMIDFMVAILDLATILENISWSHIDTHLYWCEEHLCQVSCF